MIPFGHCQPDSRAKDGHRSSLLLRKDDSTDDQKPFMSRLHV